MKDLLKHYFKGTPSESGVRVAKLLDEWAGFHHLDPAQLEKVDWGNPRYQVLKLSKFSSDGQISTWDFDMLTRLVFLAHDHCIRIQIGPCNQQFIEAVFHPRNEREGSMSLIHPTIETVVARWRESHRSLEVAPRQPTELIA